MLNTSVVISSALIEALSTVYVCVYVQTQALNFKSSGFSFFLLRVKIIVPGKKWQEYQLQMNCT
jgi:hypothetical protein